jgi:hypothetical protein
MERMGYTSGGFSDDQLGVNSESTSHRYPRIFSGWFKSRTQVTWERFKATKQRGNENISHIIWDMFDMFEWDIYIYERIYGYSLFKHIPYMSIY